MTAPAEVTMSYEDYISLRDMALRANPSNPSLRRMLTAIEAANGFTTYRLWVRWVNADETRIPSQRFPEEWPPKRETLITLEDRPVAKQDVIDAMRAAGAVAPVSVYVTSDMAKTVGWRLFDEAFP